MSSKKLQYSKEKVAERIQEIRYDHGMTKTEFADKTSWGRSSITRYESGLYAPSAENLFDLIEKFNVNLNWLVTGDGKKYNHSRDLYIAEPGVQYKKESPTPEMIEDMYLLAKRIEMMEHPKRVLIIKFIDTMLDVFDSIKK